MPALVYIEFSNDMAWCQIQSNYASLILYLVIETTFKPSKHLRILDFAEVNPALYLKLKRKSSCCLGKVSRSGNVGIENENKMAKRVLEIFVVKSLGVSF